MNVLSLFDGMSCGQIALSRLGLKVDNYFASEIDESAIKVCMNNYLDTKQIGSVVDIKGIELPKIDLLIGGSPCQDISNLSKFRLGLDGEKSSLFFQYWRMWQETKPKYFLLENVAGNKSAIAKITKLMGVRPIKLNSNWVVPQSRPRLYWTNIPVNSLPIRSKKTMVDILQDESDVDDKYYQSEGWNKWWQKSQDFQLSKGYSRLNSHEAGCLTKRMYVSWNGNFVKTDRGIRRLTPIECERLQTVPDNYTVCVEDKYRYEMLGNGWTVDIVAHIFKHIPQNK